MKSKHLIFGLILLLGLSIQSCETKKPKTEKTEKSTIVCTTSMIGDMVNQISNSESKVITLMGPGVDPHLYKPTSKDINELKNADIIVLNGLHLEGKMQEVIEKLEASKTIITIGEALSDEQLIATSEFDGNYDPHIWFDASIWKSCTQYVSNELINVVSNASGIQENTVNYLAELDALNKKIEAEISQIPEESRYLITAHDAFGYFSKAYGIQVKALQGVSTASEFGIKDVMELANFLIDHNIKSIFVESSVSSKSLEKILETCKTKGHEVKIGGELYTDALGKSGTPEGTYIGMMEHNVKSICSNLK